MKKTPRPRSAATIKALRRLSRFKNPSRQQIVQTANDAGIHWTTLYRGMLDSKRFFNGVDIDAVHKKPRLK